MSPTLLTAPALVNLVGHRLCKLLCAFSLGLPILFGIAHAQTQNALPTPGSVLDSVPGNRFESAPSPAQIIIPDQPSPTVHDRRGKRFQIHSFRFVGNTAFPTARLKIVVDRFRDLELNLYDLNVAADAVTEFYHDRGYTLARAVIPPQKVEDGVVTLAVIEGRLGKVLFSGNKSYSEDFLREHTPTLKPGVLMTTERLERSLLLLNDLPGLKVRSTLSPGAEFGNSDVLVKSEEKPYALNLALDNGGRKETGLYRADIGLEINNPLGIGDQLTIRTLVSDQRLMKYQKFGYSLPLNNDGLRLAMSYSDVNYDVAGVFAALNLSGKAQTTEFALQYPLVRSRGRNEYLSAAVRDTTTRQSTLGVETSKIRMPLYVLGYQLNLIGDDASVTNWSAQVSSNFKKNNDGTRQDAQLFRFETDGNYLLPLDRQWDVYLRGNLVWNNDRLPDSEKFSIGGPGSVRGYRSSEMRGDSGAQTTIEFRRNFSIAAKPVIFSVFHDAGRVIYKAPGFSNGWESLSSVGFGVTVYPLRQTVVKLELATPTGGNYRASDHQSSRAWLSVSTSF